MTSRFSGREHSLEIQMCLARGPRNYRILPLSTELLFLRLCKLLALLFCFLCFASAASAKYEYVVVKQSKDIRVCHYPCSKREAVRRWLPLPTHGMVSLRDKIKIPTQVSVFEYRLVASGSSKKRVLGPKIVTLKEPSGLGFSGRILRLWRGALQLMRARSSSRSGSARSPSQITKRFHFVDLLFPRNECVRKPPTLLRWLPRKRARRYVVHLFYYTSQGKQIDMLKRVQTCKWKRGHSCTVSLAGVRFSPNATYYWNVTALFSTQPKGTVAKQRAYPAHPGVYFRLLSAQENKRLSKALKSVLGSHTPLQVALHLLRFHCLSEAFMRLHKAKVTPQLLSPLQEEINCAMCRPWAIQQTSCKCDDYPHYSPHRND